jgi:hypothetical protein
MSAGSFIAGIAASDSLRSVLAQRFARLLPPDRRLLHRSALPREALVATLGPVELFRTRPSFVARTTVKGEHDAALQTALRRLADYAAGQNREAVAVPTARPVTQRPGAPGTWVVQIGLPGVYAASAAPLPRSGKVRITAQPGETLAVVCLSGRPQDDALARGATAILAAIAGSAWTASGPPMLRMHARPGLLPWTGGFQVAMPVTEV